MRHHKFIAGRRSVITRGARVNFVAEASADSAPRPGFEQARDELIELVKRLEAGGLTLEQSLQLWERGEQLAAICEDWLEGARARMAAALARREESGESPAAPF
jgi:exodeoxyribonuclease VII small subunit